MKRRALYIVPRSKYQPPHCLKYVNIWQGRQQTSCIFDRLCSSIFPGPRSSIAEPCPIPACIRDCDSSPSTLRGISAIAPCSCYPKNFCVRGPPHTARRNMRRSNYETGSFTTDKKQCKHPLQKQFTADPIQCIIGKPTKTYLSSQSPQLLP